MAEGLAQAGANIVAVGHSDDDNGLVAAVEAMGRKAIYFKANLMSIEPIQSIIDRAVEEFGKVDILVNNAGIIRREDATDFSEQDWDDVMNINIKTVFFFCQAVGNQFIKQGTGGKIINIASMLSFQGGIRVPSYTASKSGVKGITMLLANEWAKHNININAIAPGYIATDNTAQLRADAQRSAEILGRIPADRWGTPEDLAGACVFLCSDAAAYINGYTLAVDGGWLAR
jgi:2-deoxy-D-gluconate 3-dehydrogenase